MKNVRAVSSATHATGVIIKRKIQTIKDGCQLGVARFYIGLEIGGQGVVWS